MRKSLRETLTTAGSITVLLIVILVVSSDAQTVVALGSFCVVGYVLYYAYRTSGTARLVRSHVTPRMKLGIGVVVATGVIVAVADKVDEGVWLAAMCVFGYTGYRSGRVFRGALYGAVVGIGCAVALGLLVGGTLLFASVFDIAGTRDLLYKLLLAPPVVGFFTLLWGVFLVLLGGITGLISGGVGGAISRLL